MVFMMSPPSPELICRSHRIYMKEQLDDVPDKELEELILDLNEKYGDKKVDYSIMAFYPDHDLFWLSGSVDVLRERYGQDYVDRFFNLRRPRTIVEKLRTLIFNETFTYSN